MAQYADVTAADAFFATRLHTEAWDSASTEEKDAALNQATSMIERLNFAGDVSDPSQPFQFPRGGDIDIPTDICQAEFLIAYQLLDGVEPEQEQREINIKAHGYSTVRSLHDRSFAQEYMAAGIPSIEAWRLIRPFLRRKTDIRLDRIS